MEKTKTNGSLHNEDDTEDTIEGFGYCTSQQSKCLTDCVGGTPALSSLN